MKIVIINKSDSTGGAAVVSFRLMKALREQGIDARMLVAEKLSDSPYVVKAAASARLKHTFITDRLNIFRSLGFKRKNLWKIDTGFYGVPLWRHPLVRHADVVCLNWINQGFLSLNGVHKIAALGKPIVWTMHDMWNMTGICHHAGQCAHFTRQCGDCPLLDGQKSSDDLSHRVWQAKHHLYNISHITFVAVSRWLAERAAASSLLRAADLRIIPNAFPVSEMTEDNSRYKRNDNTVRLIMGAARLDDPIKGLPILVEATKLLATNADNTKYELITYGTLKNPEALRDVAIPHRSLGLIEGLDALRDAYAQADIVVSPSHYETLPGTLVEGQAFGCIPVAFDSGGQSDIIDNHDTGILLEYSADPTIAAQRLAEGITEATLMLGNQQRNRMLKSVNARFAAQNVASQYISLFNQLIGD